MTAEDLLKQGDPDAALAALQESIRKAPGDAWLRIFLFQLLCVQGQWTRAVQQLRTCAMLDPAAETMAQMYREAIICEMYREKVFAGEKAPLIFGAPENWLALMIEALRLQATGHAAQADALRNQAFEQAPAMAGSLNGTAFEWVADADPRLGPVLELIINGRYFWVPFSAIRRIEVEPPTDLRDRVWMPATLSWANGGDAVALIPTRYAGSHAAPQAALRLAAATDFPTSAGDVVVAALGQRLLATDQAECALMDLRELVIESGAADRQEHPQQVSGHG